MYFPFSSNKKARGRLLLTTVKFIFMEPNGQWQEWYKTIKCTFYLNEKCNLEVTSIITIILPFYRQQGLASCMLRGAFLEHYFLSVYNFTIMFKLCYKCTCCFPSLFHIHCIQCTYIDLTVSVMVIQVDNDWSFVDPSFAYFFEWTHQLSARNDRAF